MPQARRLHGSNSSQNVAKLRSAPEILEPGGRKLCVPNSVLDALVAEPILKRPRIVALIGESVPATVPEHVGMYRERQARALVKPVSIFEQAGETSMAAHLRVIEPRHLNRSVPTRPANAELRPREYLTPAHLFRSVDKQGNGRGCFGVSRGRGERHGQQQGRRDPDFHLCSHTMTLIRFGPFAANLREGCREWIRQERGWEGVWGSLGQGAINALLPEGAMKGWIVRRQHS
jgi:hypothetical protein